MVIAEIDAAAGASAAEELTAEGGQALAVATDVADEASVGAMVAQAIATFGKIDILVNNAAIFASIPVSQGPFDQIPIDEWDRLFAVNVRGTWLCCRAVIPHMRSRGFGKIVNISSGTASKGTPNMLHYVSSKAAVEGLTRALAREVGTTTGICVNAVAPGNTESEPRIASLTQEERARALRDRIFQRPEKPEDVVGAVLFLSSPESDFITGQTIHVDGGSVLK